MRTVELALAKRIWVWVLGICVAGAVTGVVVGDPGNPECLYRVGFANPAFCPCCNAGRCKKTGENTCLFDWDTGEFFCIFGVPCVVGAPPPPDGGGCVPTIVYWGKRCCCGCLGGSEKGDVPLRLDGDSGVCTSNCYDNPFARL
jgi:hypothetical protein